MPIVPPVSWAASVIREAISGTDILHSLSSATTQSSSPVRSSRRGRVESASRSIWLAEYGISHLSDNVILLQYLRADTRLRRSVTVLKSRASAHDPEIREFDITPDGMALAGPIPRDCPAAALPADARIFSPAVPSPPRRGIAEARHSNAILHEQATTT